MTGHLRCERGRQAAALACLALAVVVVVACAAPQPDAPLGDLSHSVPALAEEVLDAVHKGDRQRLEQLAITEDEFREVVWPRLPSSRPEVGLPIEYAWGDLRQKSLADLYATLSVFSGQSYELIDVTYAGDTTDYQDFKVHRKTVLHVRAASGQTQHLRLFGSVIEYNRRVKVFSYVVD